MYIYSNLIAFTNIIKYWNKRLLEYRLKSVTEN